MKLLDDDMVITEIQTLVFCPKEIGTPIETRRTTHALVFVYGCRAVYHFLDGEVLTCHSGDCIYLPKGSHFWVERFPETDDDGRGIYAVAFSTLSDDRSYQPSVFRTRGQDEIKMLFSKAERIWRKKDAGYHEACFGYLYRILYVFKKEAATYSPRSQLLDTLAPALDYIDQNVTTESISIATLATLCKVSEPYLRRLFQRTFSASPTVYMRNLRLNYAMDLLRVEDYSVTDAAMLAGFNDASYFSREFKDKFGISPHQYREQLRDNRNK